MYIYPTYIVYLLYDSDDSELKTKINTTLFTSGGTGLIISGRFFDIDVNSKSKTFSTRVKFVVTRLNFFSVFSLVPFLLSYRDKGFFFTRVYDRDTTGDQRC